MNPIVETRECVLCGKSEFCEFKFGLIRCASCGLIVDPKIFQPDSNKAYNELFFGDFKNKGSIWVTIFETWNNFWTGRKILKLNLSGNRALEVGPGSGSFSLWLKQNGFQVKVCDLSLKICDHLSQRGLDAFCGSISELRGQRFDLIVMRHVLEHVNSPLEFLNEVKKSLSHNGVAYISVPNIACLEAKLPGWNCYEPYHLAFFEPSVLRVILKKAGFNIQSIKTKESFSGWFLAIVRTLIRFNRESLPLDKGRGPYLGRSCMTEVIYRLTMITIGFLSWPLRKVQSLMGYGDEIVAVVKRMN